MEEERILISKRELFEIEDYIRTMWQFLPIPMAFITPLGVIMQVNIAMEKLFGYTREDLIGKDVLELCPEKESIAHMQERTLRQEPVTNCEGFEILNVRGQRTPVSLSTLTRIDEQTGEPIGYFAALIDISERKQAEEELLKSEEHLRSLLRSMEDLVFVIATDGTFIDYLQPWDRKNPYTPPDSYFGKHFKDVLPKNLSDSMQSAIRRVKTSGKSHQFDYVVEIKGEKFWYDATVSPIKDKTGTINEVLAVARDITERRKTAEKLTELYEHEKSLRQKLEIEINKRIEFTRLLVHELKTPITPVLSSSELLMEELKDDSLLGLAENINRGASNLNRRIDELLDLAKGEIGTLQINPKPLNPIPLVRKIARSALPVALRKRQSLSLELPDTISYVLADEDRLYQIMLNLLQNAFKFTPTGGKIILRAMKDRANLIIEIEDTGRGISKHELKDIFESYQQVKGDRTRLSGLGLGLALSKTLIELHGGSIWVKSEKGKGSIFSFSIPLVTKTKKGILSKQV